MQYLWQEEIVPRRFTRMEGDRNTDVLVIGGGIAGVLCAYMLKEAGIDTLLVEGNRLGSGITKGTTAVLTAQHDTLYQDMIRMLGTEKAGFYLSANLQAIERFRSLSQTIDCDFEERPSIMYSLRDRALMEREAAAVRSLGFDAEFILETPLPFSVAGAVRFPRMAQFHPLKFLYGIASELNIYENTYVQKLEKTTAVTDHGNIYAKQVVVATHFPFINQHGLYFMKLYQKRSYVIALKNAPQIDCTIEDAAENGIYLRNYRDILLVGGGDHRTGENGGGYEAVRAFIRRYFPDANEVCAWSNQDCVSLDGVPYIGSYSTGLPNVYVASGFNLWGMSTAMTAATILTDMILKRENSWKPTFTPQRRMAAGQLFSNAAVTVLDFALPVTKRCAHLGCALKWNPLEHSWDCPCHGSRFDEHGRVIDNPAMHDSKVR